MSKTIHKYFAPCSPKGSLVVAIDAQGVFIHVDIQKDGACMWFIVDPNATLTKRYFIIVGTGHPIPEVARYLGTYQQQDMHWKTFVWHVFEVERDVLFPTGS